MIDPVLGYLDPGVGATLAQLAVAGTAGMIAAGKIRMNKLRRRVAKDDSDEYATMPDNPDEVAAPAE